MTTARRSLILIEAFVFSAYVGWFIWRLQTSIRPSWLVFPVWMLASFLIHRDTPKTLGWRADNLWVATKHSSLVFLPCIVALCAVGVALGAAHQRSEEHTSELQSRFDLVCRLLLEKKNKNKNN